MKPSNLSEAELLSRLVASIYDCALDPARWPDTLREIREALDFTNAMFTVWQAPTGRTMLNATSGIEAPYSQTLDRHGADIVAQWAAPPPSTVSRSVSPRCCRGNGRARPGPTPPTIATGWRRRASST